MVAGKWLVGGGAGNVMVQMERAMADGAPLSEREN